jgi:hypothetical protein
MMSDSLYDRHTAHPATADELAVSVAGLKRRYGSRTVIQGLNLRIARGEFVALLGESGCGKTTLLRALAGLDPIDGGRIDGPAQPAVVFQEPRLIPWDRLWRNVSLGLDATAGRWRKPPWKRWAWVTGSTTGRAISPVARPSAWRWHAPWCVSRGCCCWMNPLLRSMRSPASACMPWCANCWRGIAPGCCW